MSTDYAEQIPRKPDKVPEGRIPTGQYLTKFPVLTHGRTPRVNTDRWRFRVFGKVAKETEWEWDEFTSLPQIDIKSEFHCVTRWSQLDNLDRYRYRRGHQIHRPVHRPVFSGVRPGPLDLTPRHGRLGSWADPRPRKTRRRESTASSTPPARKISRLENYEDLQGRTGSGGARCIVDTDEGEVAILIRGDSDTDTHTFPRVVLTDGPSGRRYQIPDYTSLDRSSQGLARQYLFIGRRGGRGSGYR